MWLYPVNGVNGHPVVSNGQRGLGLVVIHGYARLYHVICYRRSVRGRVGGYM